MNELFKSKVCLVGGSAVGKTSLIRRFVLETFDDRYLATLGTKVTKKTLEIIPASRNSPVKMDMIIWDIMGQKGFRSLLQEAYFYGAHAIIAVCDISRKSTFKELDDWINSTFKVVGEVPVVVIGNKADLAPGEVSKDELDEYARKRNSKAFLTSAKTGDTVEGAFAYLATQAAERALAED